MPKPAPKKTAAKTKPAPSGRPAKTASAALAAPPLSAPKPIGKLEMLPMGSVFASSLNPRRAMESAALTQLADDIAANGLLQPILVRPGKKAGTHEIILGARRHAAMTLLMKDGRLPADAAIAARVREASDFELVLLAAAENLQRADLSPLEEAGLYDALRKHVTEAGRPEAAIARMLRVGERTVFKRLSLRRLAPEVATALETGEILLRQAEAFTLGEPAAQRRHLKEMKSAARTGDDDHWAARPEQIRRAMVNERFPVTAAFFDPDLYKGAIVEDLESGTRYFADGDAFAKLQEAAIAAKLKALAKDWHWVKRLKPTEPSYRYQESTRKKDPEAGAILYLEPGGQVVIKTNMLTPELAEKRRRETEQKRTKATAAKRGETVVDAEEEKPKRLLTDGQAKYVKAAKTRALRRAVAADPKAALACAILALLGPRAETRITASRDALGGGASGEVPDDAAFMAAALARAKPVTDALAERRAAMAAGQKAGTVGPDDFENEFFEEEEEEEEDDEAVPGDGTPRPSLVAQEIVVAGHGGFPSAAQAQCLTVLLALPLEDLLQLHASLVARRVGAWWDYQDRVGDNVFTVTLAQAVDAQRFLVETWRPDEAYLKSLSTDRLRGLVKTRQLVTELAKAHCEWSALGKAKKGQLVDACLAADPAGWTPSLFPEVDFIGEAALRLAFNPKPGAAAAAATPIEPPEPEELDDEVEPGDEQAQAAQ